jgi:hypothetical protein
MPEPDYQFRLRIARTLIASQTASAANMVQRLHDDTVDRRFKTRLGFVLEALSRDDVAAAARWIDRCREYLAIRDHIRAPLNPKPDLSDGEN